MKNFNIIIPITKIDEEKRLVYGIATAEQVDKSGEIMDYDSTKPYYKDWSGEIAKASGGKSLGNLREMHSSIAAGKLTQINFDDVKKQIEICAKVVDDSSWNKCLEGVLTSFSHGGEYVKTWKDPDNAKLTRYTAKPSEVSLVDNPCLASATFELLRANGTSEMRKFKTQEETPMLKEEKPAASITKVYKQQGVAEPEQVWKANDGSVHATKLEAFEKNKAIATEAEINPALKALDDLAKVVGEKEGKAKTEDAVDPELLKAAQDAGDAATDEQKELLAKSASIKASADAEALKKIAEAKENLIKLIAGLKKFGEAYDAKMAIEALCTIECLLSGEEWEAMFEGTEEGGQVADLKEAIKRIKSFIAAEIMEGTEGTMEMAMVAEVLKGVKDDTGVYISDTCQAAITKAFEDRLKTAAVAKAGARHSAKDKGYLKEAKGYLEKAVDSHEDGVKQHGNVEKAHGSMRDTLGKIADCVKVMDSDLEKAEPDKDGAVALAKVITEAAKKMAAHAGDMEDQLDKADKHHGKVTKAHTGMAEAHDGIKKAFTSVGADDEESDDKKDEKDDAEKAAANGELKKSQDELSKTKEDLAASNASHEETKKVLDQVTKRMAEEMPALIDRIKKLEAQPMSPTGALYDVGGKGVVAVKKGHEGQPADAPVEVAPGTNRGLSPGEQRKIMGIKVY